MTSFPGFAIIGSGMVADYHYEAISANAGLGASLVAVGHYSPERFGGRSEKFGVPCLSEDELLEREDVDVVCVCTPSGQHAAQTIAAAQAGKHILVEKPMALNLADADAMIRACEQSGVKLGVTLQRRAETPFKQIREAALAGCLGDLTLGAVVVPYYRSPEYYEQAGWRGTWDLDGGGVLMNQGIHLLDLLLWYFGDPVEVQAHAGTLHRDIEVEDTLAATLRFAGGALATVTATTTAAPGFSHRVEIYGTKGGIQVEGESARRWETVGSAEAAMEPPETEIASSPGAGGDPRGISSAGHAGIYRNFIEAIRHDRSPLVDGLEGRRSLAAALEIYRAAGF